MAREPKFKVGDRVFFRSNPREAMGIITEILFVVSFGIDDDGYRYRITWNNGSSYTGYHSWELYFAPNGLEVAWSWLEDNGYD
jgi:hypothetical protein